MGTTCQEELGYWYPGVHKAVKEAIDKQTCEGVQGPWGDIKYSVDMMGFACCGSQKSVCEELDNYAQNLILPFQKPLQLRLPWLPCGRCSQSFFVSQQSGVRMRRVPLAASLLLPSQQLCCKAQSSATPRLQQDHMSSALHSCLGQGQWVATCRKWDAWDLGWAHIPISA